MLFLGPEETREALSMAAAIEAMEHAFTGDSETPLRTLVGSSLVMSGRLDETVAVKLVSIVPGNPVGLVVVLDGDGNPLGIVDGPTITAIRTGAASGLATRLLAPEDASTLAMLGAGAMAPDQISAIRAVRPIRRVLVWSRTKERAAKTASWVGGEVVEDANDAVAEADVICCATPAVEPLFAGDAVGERCHINAIGAFTPTMAELPPDLLARAFVVVDDLDAAAAEAGDLIRADRQPNATLRDVLEASDRPDAQVTVFKSVGIASQDVAAAHQALVLANEKGLGTRLP